MSWGLAVLDAATARATRELPADQRAAVVAALDELRPVAPLMEKAPREAFSRVVVALDLGDVALARAIWLRDLSSEEERWAAAGADLTTAESAAAAREAEWEAFWSAVGRATLAGLRVAIPFLLAALVGA